MCTPTTNCNKYESAMKPFEQFISDSDHILRAEEPILVHLDGVGMTRKYLRKMDEAERHTFSDCLLTTAKNLCKQAETALLAYTYSDEIVLLLAGDGAAKNFHNRIQKLCSIWAARASVEMYRQLWANPKARTELFKILKKDCAFAVKCFNLPMESVGDYFKTRLLACRISAKQKNNFPNQEDWEKYGYLITYGERGWTAQSVDFRDEEFVPSPQSPHLILSYSTP